MIQFEDKFNSSTGAKELDSEDKYSYLSEKFEFPVINGKKSLYFAGHSLGLMPTQTREAIQGELDAWGTHGVEGHWDAKFPWLPYHEFITESFSKLVGATEREVVAMNTLTVNLHLMLVSFYRPTQKRFKILIENNTFPSDHYAVQSQARFHGFDPAEAIVELRPKPGRITVDDEDVLQQIEELGDSLATVMLGNCNYLSGQCFDIPSIVQKGHDVGAFVGFNLAHGAGNLALKLHDWNVDFGVWCTYKYMNSGPGSIAGAFIHENHLGQKDIPRFEGWWGQNKKTRFEMGPSFDPISTVEAWQLSNPPIFQLASLRSSMQIFDEVGMENIRNRGDQLTGYFEWLLEKKCADRVEVVTPKKRGSMLCIRLKTGVPKTIKDTFQKEGVLVDFREPDILRMTPSPLYNSFTDVFNLVELISEVLSE